MKLSEKIKLLLSQKDTTKNALINILSEECRQLEAMTQCHPIETCDGNSGYHFILYYHGASYISHWNGKKWMCGSFEVPKPTHWLLLPKPSQED
jgi:hypothetical protein